MLEKDQWLAKYFDGDAFYYKPPYGMDNLPKGFIFTKLPVDHVKDVGLLFKQGFKIVEVAIQFEQHAPMLNKQNSQVTVDFVSKEQDKNGVIKIAENAFIWSRFYQDTDIPKDIASKIKKDWVTNYFSGQRGDNMIVARINNEVVGFILLINNIIDLIAVSTENARQGIGSLLIQFANSKIGLLKAGTQLINKSSIALYEKSGFFLKQANFVLHRYVK